MTPSTDRPLLEDLRREFGALAEALARRTGTAPTVWPSGFAGALLLLSLSVGCAAWRRFRRRFLGLRETIEELREDAEWLREKTEGKRRKREMG